MIYSTHERETQNRRIFHNRFNTLHHRVGLGGEKPGRIRYPDGTGTKKTRGRGFEPRLEAPKAPVLPLDDPRRRTCHWKADRFEHIPFYQTMLLQPIKKFTRL